MVHPIPGRVIGKKGKFVCWRYLATLVAGLFAMPLGMAAAPSVDVLVNSSQEHVPLDRDLLRGIFTMRVREWPDGEPIRVFVLPDDNAVADLFDRENLGTYPYVLRAAWDRMVFTGTGLAPTVVKTEEEMRERIRTTPGAIGYVRSGGRSMRRVFFVEAATDFSAEKLP
jgi:hypothetical protein